AARRGDVVDAGPVREAGNERERPGDGAADLTECGREGRRNEAPVERAVGRTAIEEMRGDAERRPSVADVVRDVEVTEKLGRGGEELLAGRRLITRHRGRDAAAVAKLARDHALESAVEAKLVDVREIPELRRAVCTDRKIAARSGGDKLGRRE